MEPPRVFEHGDFDLVSNIDLYLRELKAFESCTVLVNKHIHLALQIAGATIELHHELLDGEDLRRRLLSLLEVLVFQIGSLYFGFIADKSDSLWDQDAVLLPHPALQQELLLVHHFHLVLLVQVVLVRRRPPSAPAPSALPLLLHRHGRPEVPQNLHNRSDFVRAVSGDDASVDEVAGEDAFEVLLVVLAYSFGIFEDILFVDEFVEEARLQVNAAL